jgi:hypothetical protein
MQDRTERSSWPSPRGPWAEVVDLSQRFDHGWPWCENAAGHPGLDRDYPDVGLHMPPFECQSPSAYLPVTKGDSVTTQRHLRAFVAAPFRFGEARSDARNDERHVVLEFLADVDGAEDLDRFSLTLGDSLRLAHWLTRLDDLITPAK